MGDKPRPGNGSEDVLIELARRQVHGATEGTPTGLSSKEFASAVLRSKLVDRETLQERANQFKEERRQWSAQGFAKFLMEQRDLTKYQAERLLAGRTDGFFLGGCKILGILGVGGMGKVYLAEQIKLGRQVAVKVLASHRADDPHALERFLREAKAVAELKHPNIVQIHDVGKKGKTHFIIMEFVRGLSLAALIKERKTFPVAESTEIIRQVATGLEHSHAHSIVHRDIKPANLVLEDQTVKILDLGLARKFDADESITEEGSGMGTPDYMSPEQFGDAHHADIRSDLYSLGCTWYHLLTGRPPFAGGTNVSKGIGHLEKTPPPIRQLAPAVPGGVVTIIEKLMAKEPADRYQSPTDLLSDLQSLDTETIAATEVFEPEAETARVNDGSAITDPQSTPEPADSPSSESLVTTPTVGVPSFLVYLIPVMAALVLGGAYFGIRALLDKQSEMEPLVIEIADGKSESNANSDTNSQPGEETPLIDRSPEESESNKSLAAPEPELPSTTEERNEGTAKEAAATGTDDAPELESPPPLTKPPAAVVESQPPVPSTQGNEDATTSSIAPQSLPARAAKTWSVGSSEELKAAWNEIIDGDQIELAGGRTFKFEDAFAPVDNKHLSLASDDERKRPIVYWPLPKKNRITAGLIQLTQGSLTVEGVDFYVDLQDQNQADSELILFSLQVSDLHLIDCSITVLNASRVPVTVVSLKAAL